MSEDLIYKSFELAADRDGDITESIYTKYFTNCPDSETLMAHIDELTRGKMMDEVYRLMMVGDYDEESGYLNWEVDNHEKAYSVESHMYDSLFTALLDTVRESLGDDWNDAYEAAWQERIGKLRDEIVGRFSETA